MSTSLESTSMTELAYEGLKERLVLLDIRPGEALNEQELAARFGVGRTPLREALKRLESDHLIVTYPRRGTFASPVDITALSEISEIRRALEPLAAEAAAQRKTPDDEADFGRLAHALAAIAPDTSARDHMDWDLQVHRAIYHATHNQHLETALIRYGNLATRIWSVAAPRLSDVGTHVQEHIRLLEAIRAGEGDRAAELMREHMTDFETRIRTVL